MTTTESTLIDGKKVAYVFYVTSQAYLCAVSINAHRIRQWSTVDIVVLMVNNTWYTQTTIDRLQKLPNVHIKQVENLAPTTHDEITKLFWINSWNKFYVFDQTEYDRVVYIDADTYLMKSLDHLFLLPSVEIAAPRAYWLPQPHLTSLLMVIEPNQNTFHRLLSDAKINGGYDMDVINRLYVKSNQFLMLPSIYALMNGEYQDSEVNHFGDNNQATWDIQYLFHYSTWKPWIVLTQDEYSINRVNIKQGTLFEKTLSLFSQGQESYCK
eukprot:gene7301-8494_t